MTTAAAKTLEEGFEDAICRQLAERGWLIDPTARVAADAELAGRGCIGAGARVGAGARLCDAVVWDSAVVPAHTVCTGGILTGNPLVDSGARPRGTDG